MSTFRDHTTLGRTGLQVSRLGIGSGYGVPAEAVEHAFHDHGVNYFYWSNPRRAGMRGALTRLCRSHRDRIVVALQTYDHLGLHIARSVRKGLRQIGTDYADVLILGWFNRHPSRRVLDAALALKAQGHIRFIAMSGHNRRTFGAIARQTDSPIDVFMVRYNAAHRGAEQEIFPALQPDRADRPGVTCYTATRWGKLLNPRKMPPGARPLTSADCYRFVLSDPHVDLCMTGPANMQQMTDALQALDAGPLTPDEMARVQRIGDHVHG